MRRVLTVPVAVVATALAAHAADELPSDDADISFDIEPPLLIQDRSAEPLSVPKPFGADAGPARLEKELERARKNASGAERLCRIGALAKVEAEQRALKVVRLESDLENARLAGAKEELIAQQGRFVAGEISKGDVANAESALARTSAAAQAAAAKRERAELDAAETNLHRQQKLLAMGSARKSDVSRAEQKLAELKTPKN